MDSAVENRFVASFVEPSRRERWAEQLSGKRRQKQLDRLYHHFEFQASSVTKLKLSPELNLTDVLAKRGSPSTCYVLSANPEFDGKVFALSQVLAPGSRPQTASVFVCNPEKLALFCDEYDVYLMENRP
jgi:hypothetical protein